MKKKTSFVFLGYCFASRFALLLLVIFLVFNPFSTAQSWKIIGNEQQLASATSAYTSVTTLIENSKSTPYVVFTEGGIARVKKYTNGEWVKVGNDVAATTVTYTSIAADKSGKLYVCYIDVAAGNRLAVKMFYPSTATWLPLGNEVGNLYVSQASVTYSISQFITTNRYQIAFDNNETPYIIFGDGAGLTPNIKKFDGNTWLAVGAGSAFNERAISVGIGIDSVSNTPYIVYMRQASASATTGSMVFAKFNGSSWDSIPIPNPAGGSATGVVRHCNISFSKDWHPLISYFNVGSSNRNTVVMYNKTTTLWSLIGYVSGRDATALSLARSYTGHVFSAFTDVITNGSGRSLGRVMHWANNANNFAELKNTDMAAGFDEPISGLSMAVMQDSALPIVAYLKANSSSIVTPVILTWSNEATDIEEPEQPDVIVTSPKQMEYLTRALVAVRQSATQVYLGWRMLGTDQSNIAFNVYRNGAKVNSTPVAQSTNYIDNGAMENAQYTVRAIVDGIEQDESTTVRPWDNFYKTIALKKPTGGTTPDGVSYTYSANDCSVGDVDGDGVYEIFVKWDPSNSQDNSLAGYTGNVYIDCYKMDGTFLWRVDLGRNIRAGAHYTQFMVYDLDGDGKAEMACKTADATIDGAGVTIGNANADYRNSDGYVLSGPEFMTIFNGLTGAAMATTDYYPARGSVSGWGDNYGNRVDRFVDAIAYVDGERPSLITGRGYYTRLVRVAWDWRNGQLTRRWVFDSNNMGNGSYAGQGNHQLTVGDVDGDGKDEIVNGSSVINDNGRGLYANGLGHGDALHMGDFDPDRPGMEIVQCHETPAQFGNYGLAFKDAKTGTPLWGAPSTEDVGRTMTADIDPRYRGTESWGTRDGGVMDAKGNRISTSRPSINFGIWWDGDLLRELLDGNKLDKWNYLNNRSDRLLSLENFGNGASNNTTKANPCLTADLLGDWREEIILRDANSDNLLIYTTTTPTDHKLYTLMHNPQYRVAVAWQNTAYNQPPWPDYYLGEGMTPPPMPNIYTAGTVLPVKWIFFTAREVNGKVLLEWNTASETNNLAFTIQRSQDGVSFSTIGSLSGKENSTTISRYTSWDHKPVNGNNYYRIKQVDKDGKSSYTQIVVLNFSDNPAALIISPNPVSNYVTLQWKTNTQRLQLRVSSVDGKVILRENGSLSQLNRKLNYSIQSWAKGMYIVEIDDNGLKKNAKMIKQ
jgi:rhamnogalacturonan endolyase